jgi:hypothetical protein
LSCWRLRMSIQEAVSRISAPDDSRIDRNPPQEWNTHFQVSASI